MRGHTSAVTARKHLPNQQISPHISEHTLEKNPTSVLFVASVFPSPPRSRRTCAFTLVNGPSSVPSVEWRLPKGEF